MTYFSEPQFPYLRAWDRSCPPNGAEGGGELLLNLQAFDTQRQIHHSVSQAWPPGGASTSAGKVPPTLGEEAQRPSGSAPPGTTGGSPSPVLPTEPSTAIGPLSLSPSVDVPQVRACVPPSDQELPGGWAHPCFSLRLGAPQGLSPSLSVSISHNPEPWAMETKGPEKCPCPPQCHPTSQALTPPCLPLS